MAPITVPDIAKILEGRPSPHYLAGGASYERKGDIYTLCVQAVFPRSDPSIGDRAAGPVPHVNVAHGLFGVWNGVHAIARLESKEGYAFLSGPGSFDPRRIMPPDTPLDLEVVLELEAKRGGVLKGKYTGTYRQGENDLLIVRGEGFMGPAGLLAGYAGLRQ